MRDGKESYGCGREGRNHGRQKGVIRELSFMDEDRKNKGKKGETWEEKTK